MLGYPQHPAEREAERLRVIIETMVHTNPSLTMDEAGPMIFKIEERAAKLESQQVNPEPERHMFTLPDRDPETIAKFIDLMPDIQAEIPHRKINAIKAVRAACTFAGAEPGYGVGLKEAKDGVECWASRATATARTVTATASGWSHSFTPSEAVEWVNRTPQITDEWDAPSSSTTFAGNKIRAIKECRAITTLGLKEAKDLIERWASVYR